MKDKIIKYTKEALLFVVIMTIFANAISLYRSMDLNKNPLVLESVTLIDDSLYALQKEKPVLLHFWATWCPTCKAEAGNIQAISKSFEVITIAVKSGSNDEIVEYLKSRDLNFRVINDNNGYITNQFDVSVFPTTIIYDKDKNVVFSDVGYTSTWGLWLRMWWVS